jgi:pyruvate/2-oxoglutarate dehydrogenase complex dihydrolipoamide dehydrogenase (E3) component/bacterioferritin (cytochrome b1)
VIERYDSIVIGAGQAGPSLAMRLAQAGRPTAIIERKHLGGTCVNAGCIPTKTLIASSRVAWQAQHAADYGVTIQGVIGADMGRVKARKDALVRETRRRLEKWLEAAPDLVVVRGHARLEGPRTVRVGERLMEAEHIFLNVGTRAFIPELPGVDAVGYLTNSTILHLAVVPAHLVVVGGSFVGLEFAQMFRRLGAEVTVVERGPRLLAREDADVSEAVREMLQAEGIAVRLEAECIALERRDAFVAVSLRCAQGPPAVEGSHVLLAVGRQPNTDDLGLEAAGVTRDARGFIPVDAELRTGVPGIWALGDVNRRGAFTHTAYNDYEIVAANLLEGAQRRVTDRVPAYALYVDPPLGRAGLTEREVRALGRPALVGRLPMARVHRARARGETRGFMKVLADAGSGEILGAAILGIEGDEVIHTLVDAMHAGVPYTVLGRTMHIHPTVAEFVPTLLQQLQPMESEASMETPSLSDIKTIRERARQHIEQGAVTPAYKADRDAVVRMLNEALATELVCALRYRRHYFTVSGIDAKLIADEFKDHAGARQAHADELAERIVQLGGAPDFSPRGLQARSRTEYVAGSSLLEMVRENLVAERVAIDSYREMIAFVGERDPTTRRLLEEVLADEEEHAKDLADMLKELGQMHTEHLMDEALQESFPASDVPAPAVDEVLREK